MATKKYTDWSSWWDGLRTNIIKCIGTTGTAWIGSNALSTIPISGFKNLGLSWEQAVGFFGIHIAVEVFNYMKTNQPQVVTEEVATSFVSKNPVTGATVTQESTKTTTTPVPEPPKV